jgi:hypothetical protein
MKVIKLTESDLTNIVKRVIKESNTKNYSKSILGVLEGFEDDYVCGFDVDYQENYDTYLIKIIVGNRDLDNDFKVSVSQRHYLNKLKKDVTEYLFSYLPIKFLVDFKRTANCSDYKKYKQMTESDETNIVKRVIKESAAKDSLIDMIKYDGWGSAAELVGGIENLKRLMGIESPMDYLNLFNDMDAVQSEEKPNWTLYRYEKGNNMMIHIRESGVVFMNYTNIWSFLKEGFDLNSYEIKLPTEEWLSEVYNLRDAIVSWANNERIV